MSEPITIQEATAAAQESAQVQEVFTAESSMALNTAGMQVILNGRGGSDVPANLPVPGK